MKKEPITLPCQGCSSELGFDVSMAYQPIVDCDDGSVFAYEALVRGVNGEPAGQILERVTDENRFAFDQRCRMRAVETAAALGLTTKLSINFMPNAVYEPTRCLQTTLSAAARAGFPVEQIIFEATEEDRVRDPGRLKTILSTYRHHGFLTAIDDFGSGYAGLNLLADFQPDIIKLDMVLVRGIDANRARQAIIGGIMNIARLLGIRVIAEGVETRAEFETLRTAGVSLMQGYLFAKPGFQCLPPVEPSVPGLALQRRSG